MAPPPQTPPPSPPTTAAVRGPHVLAAITVLLLALAVRLPLLDTVGFHGDQLQFLAWAERVTNNRLASAYDPRPDRPERRWCNYPPLYLYVLRGLGELYPTLVGRPLDASAVIAFGDARDPAFLNASSTVLKIPGIAADAVLAALLVLWLAPRWGLAAAVPLGALYAVIPGVLHDSAVWGQVDGLLALLMVVSLEMARRERPAAMAAFAAAALLMKAQAVVLLPVWVAALWRYRDRPTVLARAVVIAVLVAAAILLPFVGALDGVIDAYAGAAGYYPYTHLNGFSIWFLLHPLERPHLDGMAAAYKPDDAPLALGLTPRVVGLAGVLVLWIASFVYMIRRNADAAALRAAALCLPIGFFLFATQMHERYLLPAVAIWAWGYQPTGRWRVCFLLLAICVSINVFWGWPGPHASGYAARLGEVLRRSPLGLAMGSWCAIALILLLADSILEWGRAPRANQSRSVPSDTPNS